MLTPCILISEMQWGNGLAGVLQKQEGRNNKRRWTEKWVTCDEQELCYYNTSFEPPGRKYIDGKFHYEKRARKIIPLEECSAILANEILTIQLHQKCSKKVGNYTATFRCADPKTYLAWSKFLRHSVVDVSHGDSSSVAVGDKSASTDGLFCGSLLKLEGHRNALSHLNVSIRWKKKWVVCDRKHLLYYNCSSKPSVKQRPRKKILLKNCAVRILRNMRIIEIDYWPKLNSTEDDDDQSYKITFKCDDVNEFSKWTEFFYSIKSDIDDLPQYLLIQAFIMVSYFYQSSVYIATSFVRSFTIMSYHYQLSTLMVISYLVTKIYLTWGERNASYNNSLALPNPNSPPTVFSLMNIVCFFLITIVVFSCCYKYTHRRKRANMPRIKSKDNTGAMNLAIVTSKVNTEGSEAT